MSKIEKLKKEAEENLQKFMKEHQLLQQRMQVVTKEIIALQGEIRGYDKQIEKKTEPQKTTPKKRK